MWQERINNMGIDYCAHTIIGVPVDDVIEDHWEEGMVGNYEIVHSYVQNHYFIELWSMGNGGNENEITMVTLDKLNSIIKDGKQKFQETLEPFGYWDEDKFGVYCNLYLY